LQKKFNLKLEKEILKDIKYLKIFLFKKRQKKKKKYFNKQ